MQNDPRNRFSAPLPPFSAMGSLVSIRFDRPYERRFSSIDTEEAPEPPAPPKRQARPAWPQVLTAILALLRVTTRRPGKAG